MADGSDNELFYDELMAQFLDEQQRFAEAALLFVEAAVKNGDTVAVAIARARASLRMARTVVEGSDDT